MNELLLQELYGNNDADTVKQAQAELVQQVAIEAGIDINELSDEDLAKFAHYVLTDGAEVQETRAPEGMDEETLSKIAEADAMGRLMARSYVDEQMKIASAVETGNWEGMEDVQQALVAREVSTKVASATNAIAYEWAMAKEAASAAGVVQGAKNLAGKLPGVAQIKAGVNDLKALKDPMNKAHTVLSPESVQAGISGAKKQIAIGGAKALGAVAVPTAIVAGVAGHKKKASLQKEAAVSYVEELEPQEFAKLAEYRAAEILAANGIHPETFEEIEPTAIKLAEFPSVEDCNSWEAKMAMKVYNDHLNASAVAILESLGFAG